MEAGHCDTNADCKYCCINEQCCAKEDCQGPFFDTFAFVISISFICLTVAILLIFCYRRKIKTKRLREKALTEMNGNFNRIDSEVMSQQAVDI